MRPCAWLCPAWCLERPLCGWLHVGRRRPEKVKMLKFLIVSPVVHVHSEGRYGGYTPYVREMNLWLHHVDRVRIIAPLSQEPPDALETFYTHPNLDFVAVPALRFTNKKEVLSSLSKLPLVLFRLLQGMAWASHIHLRCPSNMGLLGLLVQFFFPFTRKTAKYANNWDWNSRQPRSYRLQQRLLRSRFWSRRMRVMVYGDWGERSRNILPFFTASYSKTQALPLEPRSLTELPLRLIFVGTLTPNKGPLTAIKVVELLRGRGLEVRLDLFGDGRQRADALNMQGARVMGRPGEVDMLALKAGNDVVEFTEDLPGAIAAVKKALADSLLCPHEMEAKCRRALAFQYWLSERPQVKGVDSVLHTDDTLALNRLLYEAALTVLHNEAVLPFASKRLDQQEVLLLGTAPVLRDSLRSLGLKVQNLALHDPAAFRRQLAGIGEEVGLIFVIGDSQWGRRAANAALRQEVIQLLKRKQALTVFMGNAYHLAPWRELDASGALVLAYENNDRTQEAVWRLLTGQIGADGRLPVTIGQWYAAGSGIDLAPLNP